jgi:hypothetical protein
MNKYHLYEKNGERIATYFTRVDGVKAALSYDGYGYAFLRMNEEGEQNPSFPMRCFYSDKHIGNNDFRPNPKRYFNYESSHKNDTKAIQQVCKKLHLDQCLHPRYDLRLRRS